MTGWRGSGSSGGAFLFNLARHTLMPLNKMLFVKDSQCIAGLHGRCRCIHGVDKTSIFGGFFQLASGLAYSFWLC